MTPLAKLVAALHTGASLLPWCVEHVSEGKPDAVIEKEWSTEPDGGVLVDLLALAYPHSEFMDGFEVWNSPNRSREEASAFLRDLEPPTWVNITTRGPSNPR